MKWGELGIHYTILCPLCIFKHFHDKKLKFFTNLISNVLVMFTIWIYLNLCNHFCVGTQWFFWVLTQKIMFDIGINIFSPRMSLYMKFQPHLKFSPWEGLESIIYYSTKECNYVHRTCHCFPGKWNIFAILMGMYVTAYYQHCTTSFKNILS